MHTSRRVFVSLAICGSASLGATGLFGTTVSALDQDELPFYSRADLIPRWDFLSRWNRIGSVALTEASGKHLAKNIFSVEPTIISFFWAGCVTVCPGSIQLLIGIKGKPRIILITEQPQFDTPAVLTDFRHRLALPDHWQLVTGQPNAIYDFARRSLFTDVEARRSDRFGRHPEINYLVDRYGRLRGLYDAHSPADSTRLQSDLERLRTETANASKHPLV